MSAAKGSTGCQINLPPRAAPRPCRWGSSQFGILRQLSKHNLPPPLTWAPATLEFRPASRARFCSSLTTSNSVSGTQKYLIYINTQPLSPSWYGLGIKRNEPYSLECNIPSTSRIGHHLDSFDRLPAAWFSWNYRNSRGICLAFPHFWVQQAVSEQEEMRSVQECFDDVIGCGVP